MLLIGLVTLQGPPGKLAATAPSLQQLDLTDNLIGSWATIISICQQLPSLHLLNLSHNRLQLPARLPDAGLQQLPGLQCLVLNHCNITWQQVRLVVLLLVYGSGWLTSWRQRTTAMLQNEAVVPKGHCTFSAISQCTIKQCCCMHVSCGDVCLQVAVLQSSLPNLQELHAAGNNISSLHVQADNSTSSNHQQQQEHGQEWPPLVGFNSLKVRCCCSRSVHVCET